MTSLHLKVCIYLKPYWNTRLPTLAVFYPVLANPIQRTSDTSYTECRVVVSSESAFGAPEAVRRKLQRTFPMRCTTLLPLSFRLCLFARAKQQHANAKRAHFRFHHRFATFLSATLTSAFTLAPSTPALSRAVRFARRSELAAIDTLRYLLCLRFSIPSPLHSLLTPGEPPPSPLHTLHLAP